MHKTFFVTNISSYNKQNSMNKESNTQNIHIPLWLNLISTTFIMYFCQGDYTIYTFAQVIFTWIKKKTILYPCIFSSTSLQVRMSVLHGREKWIDEDTSHPHLWILSLINLMMPHHQQCLGWWPGLCRSLALIGGWILTPDNLLL